MSKYLNPRGVPKEVWLFDNGMMVPNPCLLSNMGEVSSLETIADNIIDLLGCGAMLDKDYKNNEDLEVFEEYMKLSRKERDAALFEKFVIVDMVNNGKFRAAAVYTSRDECMAVYNDRVGMLKGDQRQRIWFLVKKELAMPEIRGLFDN